MTLYLCVKLVQYNEYLVNIVDIGGLVLYHQSISSYSADYAPTSLQLHIG